MFNFLENWDPILADFKCDIDGVIKGEVKLWTVAMQTYCERLMKLFNNKERIYPDDRITFGYCVSDTHFKDIFQESDLPPIFVPPVKLVYSAFLNS